ncbi:hypothetical protein A1D22_10810 [Pasteurellaceae bacterium LFhippo2]|nr:hypothetical protein [Pasteurellaceae bacterium LFhippo2]
MSSLSLVSTAVASAIAVAQPFHTSQEYQAISNVLSYEESVIGVDITELTNRIFMAERTLYALYQLATKHNIIFKQSSEIEWMNMFKESAGLLFYCKQYALENQDMSECLIQFEETLNKITYLFKACKYQQRTDEVVMDRLYNSSKIIGLKFDGSLSREEKRQQLLSKRRV